MKKKKNEPTVTKKNGKTVKQQGGMDIADVLSVFPYDDGEEKIISLFWRK